MMKNFSAKSLLHEGSLHKAPLPESVWAEMVPRVRF
jgi:hypothetical protein